jgi:hypothetical protein
VGGAEDAGFVEEGIVGSSGCGEEEGVRWGGTDELAEGDIVLQERYLVGGIDGGSGGVLELSWRGRCGVLT